MTDTIFIKGEEYIAIGIDVSSFDVTLIVNSVEQRFSFTSFDVAYREYRKNIDRAVRQGWTITGLSEIPSTSDTLTPCQLCGEACVKDHDFCASYCEGCKRAQRVSDLYWTMFNSSDDQRAAEAKAELIAMGEYESEESTDYAVTITVTDDKGCAHCVHIGKAFDYNAACAVKDQAIDAYMDGEWLMVSPDGIEIHLEGPIERRTKHTTTIRDIFGHTRFHADIRPA